MDAIHFPKLSGGRKLENMSANELRAKLILAGVNIPETIKTKKELVELVKKYG